MLYRGGVVMDGFVDIQDAVKAESKSRMEKIEKLSSFSAFLLLATAT